MPVAFHPPLEHPIEPPQATRRGDDAVNGDLFAALLASAGKVPAGGEVAGIDSDHRKDPDDHGAEFDPASAFALWTTTQPASGSTFDASRSDTARHGQATAAIVPASGKDAPDRRHPVATAPPTDGAGAAAADRAATDLPFAKADGHASGGLLIGVPVAKRVATAATAPASGEPGPDGALQRAAGGKAISADPRVTMAATGAATNVAADPAIAEPSIANPSVADHSFAAATRTRRTAPATHPRDANAMRATLAGIAASRAESAASNTPPPTPLAMAVAMLAKASEAKSALEGNRDSITRDGAADAAPGVNLGATAGTAATATLVRQVADPVGSPGFATQVAGEIAQLINVKADQAQLHVHPADMGPIDVTMHVHHDQVTVTMVAADPQTRIALEQSLPQLRDLLAGQGLALANASVNDHAPRHDNGTGAHAGGNPSPRVAAIDAAPPLQAASSLAMHRLVDLYA